MFPTTRVTRRARQTNLTITAPYVPPAPKTQALCSISFADDKKRPTRVDNEAKACLDQVALDLKQQADAKAVVVGESNARREGQDGEGADVRRPSTSAPRWMNSPRSAP